MGANDVARVVGRTTDQIAEERIARLNEALAARERERPVMKAWDEQKVAGQRAAREALLSGRGGQGDADTHLNNAATMALAATAASTSLPAAMVSAVPPVAQAKRDLERHGIKVFDDPEAALNLVMLGTMIAGNSGIKNLETAFRSGKWAPPAGYPVPNLARANKMLSDFGGKWSRLTREQKLAILGETGLQMRHGGRGAWEYMPAGNIRSRGLTSPKSGTYADIFDFDAVPEYEIAFPGITKMPVEFERTDFGVRGSHTAAGVTLSDKYMGPMRSFSREQVGVHEFLHEMQRRAGQPPGADSSTYLTTPLLHKGQELTRLMATPTWRGAFDAVVHPLKQLRMANARSAVDRNLATGLLTGKREGAYQAYLDAGGEMGSRLGDFVNTLRMSPEQKIGFLLDDFSNLTRNPLDYRLPDEYIAGLDNGVIPARQDAKGGQARKSVRADEAGGDVSAPETAVSEPAVSEPAPQDRGGPRIVVNPTTFRNKKDALCVAFNEAFRILMEDMSFSPVSEPTDEQRRFFADTAYADDEEQLRRTILARICTFDTSVENPTDEQLQEAVEFLESVMEAGYPRNEWEQSAVQRIHDVIAAVPTGQGKQGETPKTPADDQTTKADIGGGDAGDEPRLPGVGGFTSDDVDAAEDASLNEREATAENQAEGGQAEGGQAKGPEENAAEPVDATRFDEAFFVDLAIANRRRKRMWGDVD